MGVTMERRGPILSDRDIHAQSRRISARAEEGKMCERG